MKTPDVSVVLRKSEKRPGSHLAPVLLTGYSTAGETRTAALLPRGEDIAYVSRQMGHAKVSIAADIYTHLLKEHRPEAAKRTDELLFGKAATASE